MSNPTLSEIWLRLGKDAVKKALVDGNGKITRKGLKDLNAFSEDLLFGKDGKEGMGGKDLSLHPAYHVHNVTREFLKEYGPKSDKPYRADCSEAEWAVHKFRTRLVKSIKADSLLPKETLEAKCETELSKMEHLKTGETMDEAAQRGKGFKVDDLLNEVEKILSLTKQDQQDRHERRERRDGEDRPGAAE